jgi:S-adenosylmethionine:tRNA ribosyltransferase-isomerase
MRVDDFKFELPPELIAQRPSPERGGSRLMQVPIDGPPTIAGFETLLDAFTGDEVLVLNDTRVVPARVFGHKPSGGQVELLIVEPLPDGHIAAMTRGTRLKPGRTIVLPGGAEAEFVRRHNDGTAVLKLRGVPDLWTWLDDVGAVPLPPYIERDADDADRARYQTVFAREPGAVAAPTAGLHLTDALLEALVAKGVEIQHVTLHVGPGTFRPVRTEHLADHKMHSERYTVPAATAAAVRSGRPVIAVGTTVVRALESYALDPSADRTEIFIYPGFEFQLVDGLITNFHLPGSTLLMLISAFAGQARVLSAYQAAVQARMHFFSYGDATLLRREGGRWT